MADKPQPAQFPKWMFHGDHGKQLFESPSEVVGDGWCESPAECGLPPAFVPAEPGGMVLTPVGATTPDADIHHGLGEMTRMNRATKLQQPAELMTAAQQRAAVARTAAKR